MHFSDVLRHYGCVLRRRLALILLGMIAGGMLALTVSMYLPPVYQAKTLLRVNVTGVAPAAQNGDVFSTRALAVSYAQLVTSPEVFQEAARKLPGMTPEQIEQAIGNSTLDDTELIEIRGRAADARMAANVTNIVADVFIDLQIRRESERLQVASDRLVQSLAQVHLQTEEARKKLTDLQATSASAESIAQQQSLLDAHQSDYQAMLSEHMRLQEQKLQVRNVLSVVQPATLPERPLSTPPWLNALLAGAMSLLLMVVLVLVYDWLDVTVQTEQDVETLAGLTPLGSIPQSRAGSRLLSLTEDRKDSARNALGLLGTSLLALRSPARAIVVTGTRTGNGATASTLSLALSLVQAGQRVLLIDANLRRPQLGRVFSPPHQRTLEHALADMRLCQQGPVALKQIWLDEWKTSIPDLWFLPACIQPDPSATVLRQPEMAVLCELLLGRERASSAITQSSQRLVDFILFDAAALADGADTLALAAVVDGLVLIIEAGKERGDTLREIQAILSRLIPHPETDRSAGDYSGMPILGVVVNRQHAGHRSYFYQRRAHNENISVDGQTSVVEHTRLPDRAIESGLHATPSEPGGTIASNELSPSRITLPSRPARQKELSLSPMRADQEVLDYSDNSDTTDTPAPISITEKQTSHFPDISLIDTPVPLPVPQLVAGMPGNGESDDRPESFTTNSNHMPRLQFAPRLRINSLSGLMQQVQSDPSSTAGLES